MSKKVGVVEKSATDLLHCNAKIPISVELVTIYLVDLIMLAWKPKAESKSESGNPEK